jgi:hypothetical protein
MSKYVIRDGCRISEATKKWAELERDYGTEPLRKGEK